MLKKLTFLVPALALAGVASAPVTAQTDKVVIKRGGHHEMSHRARTKIVIKKGHRRPNVTKKVVIHRSE